ncbi:MAG: succinate dehydrogenase, hydrophobic membrane anchor protein [Brachymonas sp.]|nr:succinate dehydrogenase, hydrophobic membrane anchor protein [Brachymonas sp.]
MAAHSILQGKRLTSGTSHGLRDWLMQRVTAALLLLFTLVLVVQVLLISGPITYEAWAGIFAPQWMKSLTFVTIVALCWHTFVGMRDIFMDYIKPMALRILLHVGAIVWLVACCGWALQVLWRI